MSQYQYVKDVEVCLRNHEVYRSKEDVKYTIEENRKTIETLKQKLFGMVCGSIETMFPPTKEDDYPSLDKAQMEFYRIFEDELCGIETLIAHNVDLQYIYDNFERSEIG